MIKVTENKTKAWVTFSIIPSQPATKVYLRGEWNQWEAEEMKAKKDGSFYLRKSLPRASRFEFGYQLDESVWMVDDELPTAPSPFGSDNSVLTIE